MPTVPELFNIPDFIEDRFFVRQGAFAWHVMYHEEGRDLALMTWDDERLARSRCRVLNDLFYDAVTEAADADPR